MALSKKMISCFRDLIFQTVFFYIIFLSPLGSIGWKLGVFETPKIFDVFYATQRSDLPVLISFPYYLVLDYLFSILLSIIPLSMNILIYKSRLKIGDYDLLLIKILMMFVFNAVYLLAWMRFYMELIWRDLMFPIFLTLIFYLMIVNMRKRNS
ncbi:MAG: hypothetical protein JWN78_1434 [Bacteroidota bacterium]|nr:hypothetical protein [Bacteroidota bacterium]